jgi:Domain of unknown function (DUF3846)
MATLIKVNGEQTEVAPWNGKAFTLEQIQEHVGGYFEAHRLSDGKFMLVDEDGKRKQKPINRAASFLLFGKYTGFDFIVGDALIGTKEEFDGDEE